MILDDDQQILESIQDDFPITTNTLKSMGWTFETYKTYYIGHGRYVHYTVWKYYDSYVDLYISGKCFYRRNHFDTSIQVNTVKELKEWMYRF